MTEKIRLSNIAIVLNRPHYPENIGAAARAMKNMGIGRLAVVSPVECDLTRVLKMATHAAIDVVEEMEVFDDLRQALDPYRYVVGTTARLGGERRSIRTPEEMARELIPISRENDVAILFGPEDRGLTNEEIRNCHALVNIPTADFSSLNLAQAVMVLCYALFMASREEKETFVPRLATRRELEEMYAQLKDVLIRISFLNPENPDYWLNNLRRFFSRFPLRAWEVRVIRGICRQIDWYGKKRFQDGFEQGRKELE